MRRIILFGAGTYGKRALDYFGRENIACFADNDKTKEGRRILDIPVISFQQLREIHGNYEVVISAIAEASFQIAAQLEEAGIHNYQFFLKILEGEKKFAPNPEQSFSEKAPDGCKRLLMAAYYFPPLGGSGVFRSIKFAKYLPQFHWWPTVISTDCPPLEMSWVDGSLVQEIPAGMQVIRIPDLVYTMRMRSIPENIEAALINFLKTILQSDQEASTIVNTLSRTKTGRVKLLMFPCPALLWAYESIQYLEKYVDLSKFQAIYTTSGPYSAHLIGLYLKQKYGISWVADYRDPWTDASQEVLGIIRSNYQLLVSLERILLKEADYSIAVEEHFAQAYVERFHIPAEKIETIPNGYDEDDFSGLSVSEEQPSKFTIVYSGLLYAKSAVSCFSAFLEALCQLTVEGKVDLDKIQLLMIGEMTIEVKDLLRKYDLDSALIETGYLSHKEALQANMRANLLLSLTGESPELRFIHGGKMFDYLRSGRPILAMVPKNGVVERLLRETGHGEAFTSMEVSGIKAMILREYQAWRQGEKRELLHSPLIEQFERKNLTRKLAEILERIGPNDCGGRK